MSYLLLPQSRHKRCLISNGHGEDTRNVLSLMATKVDTRNVLSLMATKADNSNEAVDELSKPEFQKTKLNSWWHMKYFRMLMENFNKKFFYVNKFYD